MYSIPTRCLSASILILSIAIGLKSQNPFITTWQTTTPNESIIIPVATDSGYVYNYTIDWGDGTIDTTQIGDASHIYIEPGTYQVSISGQFPAICFGKSDGAYSNAGKVKSIDQWGSQVWQTMEKAFSGCSINEGKANDIPNLSQVQNTAWMFKDCRIFNQDIGDWNMSNVKNMESMFEGCLNFDQDIGGWDVSNVTNMTSMFKDCRIFNQDIGDWDVSNVTNMESMFEATSYTTPSAAFNQDIGDWDVSNVTNMESMFKHCHFLNQDISEWDVGKVSNMESMFESCWDFNQDIGEWNVSNVNDMHRMFKGAIAFNQDIGEWDVSKVTDMGSMFSSADKFNQDIGNWNVGNVTNMKEMFRDARLFNQNIGDWDVSKVTNMAYMFETRWVYSDFNQYIGNWDVSNVTTMRAMFNSANSFNQNIGEWDVRNVTDMIKMFKGVKLSTENYDSIMVSWSELELLPNVVFDGGLSTYCVGNNARQSIIENFGWYIGDGGLDPDCTTSVKKTEWNIQNMVFPNPTNGRVNFSDAILDQEVAQLFAIDLKGKRYDIQYIGNQSYLLPDQPGTYLLICRMKDGSQFVQKVVVVE